jgi:hypothetical protein
MFSPMKRFVLNQIYRDINNVGIYIAIGSYRHLPFVVRGVPIVTYRRLTTSGMPPLVHKFLIPFQKYVMEGKCLYRQLPFTEWKSPRGGMEASDGMGKPKGTRDLGREGRPKT